MLKVKTVAETLDAGELKDRLEFDEVIMGGCLFVCVFGAVALAIALSIQTILEAARAAGLRLLTRQQIEARRLTRVIRALADGRRDLQEVARLAGCSRNAVATRRKAYGLDIPDGAGGRPQKAGVT